MSASPAQNGGNDPLPSKSQWLFTEDELKRTPSQLDGMPPATEAESRGKGVNFIIQAGIMLRLPQITLETATVFFHRFYVRHSMVDKPGHPGFHYYSIAATSLFLASKVEENPRQMKDFVITFCRLAQKNVKLIVDEQSKDYWRWRDTLLHTEELLIEAICFDLHLESPSRLLADLLQRFHIDDDNVRVASNVFLRDSSFTTLCLTSTPKVIAAAALYVGARHCDYPVKSAEQPWWKPLGVKTEDLEKAASAVVTAQEKPEVAQAGNLTPSSQVMASPTVSLSG